MALALGYRPSVGRMSSMWLTPGGCRFSAGRQHFRYSPSRLKRPSHRTSLPKFPFQRSRGSGVAGVVHLIDEVRFASDSPVEGAGFEPSVPRSQKAREEPKVCRLSPGGQIPCRRPRDQQLTDIYVDGREVIYGLASSMSWCSPMRQQSTRAKARNTRLWSSH
jgi:hypothetical protein